MNRVSPEVITNFVELRVQNLNISERFGKYVDRFGNFNKLTGSDKILSHLMIFSINFVKFRLHFLPADEVKLVERVDEYCEEIILQFEALDPGHC